ncbi:MAG: sigma-70 family RNA polymerase sigma factor [Anaerolineales bacterium]|nr:sigma-70 family RNA polymerase sigma factor [Anaerolineales bacterium]
MKTRTNAEWLTDLRADTKIRDAALIDLRAVIANGLPYALSNWLSPSEPQFDSLAEDVAQDALLKVLKHLDSFQGRSQFTTWVQKIAVRVALTELRRRRWKDVSLDSLMTEEGEQSMPFAQSNSAPDPARAAEQSEMLAMLERLMAEEMTEKQHLAMIAVRVNGMPIEEVARQMGMERNALYKLLHDARLKLKKRMEREGLTPEEVLSAFG